MAVERIKRRGNIPHSPDLTRDDENVPAVEKQLVSIEIDVTPENNCAAVTGIHPRGACELERAIETKAPEGAEIGSCQSRSNVLTDRQFIPGKRPAIGAKFELPDAQTGQVIDHDLEWELIFQGGLEEQIIAVLRYPSRLPVTWLAPVTAIAVVGDPAPRGGIARSEQRARTNQGVAGQNAPGRQAGQVPKGFHALNKPCRTRSFQENARKAVIGAR